MADHGDFSPEARTRAQRTVLVADVFADNAEVIVSALPDLPEDHVLVAVVEADHSFGGSYHIDRAELVERVPVLERDGGWAMVFSPGSTAADVRKRADELATIAGQRAAAIERIIARRTGAGGAVSP